MFEKITFSEGNRTRRNPEKSLGSMSGFTSSKTKNLISFWFGKTMCERGQDLSISTHKNIYIYKGKIVLIITLALPAPQNPAIFSGLSSLQYDF